ncbi:MAG: MFS transporter [Candidatus Hodarchaeales archaeon]|jgi:MFS family permease
MSIQFSGLFFFVGFRTIYPIILEFSLNFTETQVIANWSIIYSIGLLIGFMTRVPMGIFVDRYSRLRSIFLGNLLIILSLLGILFTENILIFSLLFGLLRTGCHAFPLISRSYVGETNPAHQGRLNSLMQQAANIGGILGPLLLSMLFEISLQWLIWSSCFILILFNVGYLISVPSGSKSELLSLKMQLTNSTSEILKLKTIVLIFIINGIISGINESVKVPYARYVLDLTPTEIGLLVSIIQLSSIIAIFFSGELVDQFGVYRLILVGIGSEALAGLIITLTKSPLTFLIGQVLMQSGIFVTITASVTAITVKVSKKTFSTSFGMATSFFFLGSAVIPVIAGELYLIDTGMPYLVIFLINSFLITVISLILVQKGKTRS